MKGWAGKSRSSSGMLGGSKGKGKKGKGMMMGGSSFKTYKQGAPSTSIKLPGKATSRKK